MSIYREQLPPEHLMEAVECAWAVVQTGERSTTQRVLPDGCADIVFTRGAASDDLFVVGAMTKFEDFELQPGALVVGIRFRPGMWAAQFGIPCDRITDQRVALEDVWGARARSLRERLRETQSAEGCLAQMAGSVLPLRDPTPIQRAIVWMEERHGMVSIEEISNQAALSARQFRRVCLEQTGLTPKLLSRILRFRYTLSQVGLQVGEHAGLAADCGYYDQSHFIAEFQRFSGRSPGTHLRSAS